MTTESSSAVQEGLKRNLISLSDDHGRITYEAINKSCKFTDPEEKVRAEYYVQLITRYGYSADRLDLEVIVPRRTPSDLADIVVYSDFEKKQPYIVVECKREDISDSEFSQAIEQAFGNANSLGARFVSVVAGNTRRFFDLKDHPSLERSANIISDIPVKYGKVEEAKFKKGDSNWDIVPVDRSVLLRLLSKCHDSLWDGGKKDATEAFDELCKYIFVKMQDEMRPRKKGDPYDFQIKTHETPVDVHQRIAKLYDRAKASDPEVFSDAFSIDPQKTFVIVNHLESISLSKTDLDTKGVAFEKFMEDFFKGKQGQYFTPREIVRLVIEICDIDRESLVLDPACGSGGFLLYAMDCIRSRASDYYDEGSVEHFKYWHEFASNRLYGMEINDRISRVAKMNMVIHDDGHTNVVCCDALDTMDRLSRLNSGLSPERFDLILTNPPFGAKIRFDEKPYKNTFLLGKQKNGTRKDQQSEILFIERCEAFLKPGTGHLAIVVPDGILTNLTQGYVREFIVEKFDIKAIISLPQVTFEHYGAGVKSSILIGRKRGNGETLNNHEFFAAISEAVGYDATGHESDSDFDMIIEEYRKFNEGKTRVDRDLIFTKNVRDFDQNRLDPYYYSPIFDRMLDRLSRSTWPLKTLKDVCVSNGVFSGQTPKKDDYSDNPSDTRIIKVASLKNGRVDLKQTGHVKEGLRFRKQVRDGDILLLSAAHSSDYIGRNPCILEIENGMTLPFVAEIMCIRADRDKINPYFLIQVLATSTYYHLINRERRGQSSHIYPRDIQNIRVPVPDIEIQNQVAEEYRKACSRYKEMLDEAEKFMTDTTSSFGEHFIS